MLDINQKIDFLKSVLEKKEENYADSFKADIVMYFDDDFRESNVSLNFLNTLHSFTEIEDWVNKLTSGFVMKFDSEQEQEGDFIHYYLNG